MSLTLVSPARRSRPPPATRGGWGAYLLAGACAALVLLPVANLARLALAGDGSAYRDLAGAALLPALRETGLLLVGVALVAGLLGTGTAWLVTVHRFPGRALLAPALVLPLAVPTYVVAYAYGDVLGYFGPVQTGLRALFGWSSPRDYAFPEVRSVGGAALVMGLVLYPYVYLAARAMFATQSAALMEAARTLGAGRGGVLRHVALPLARPALAAGLALVGLETLNDVGASAHLGLRTLTLAISTAWFARSDLPGAAGLALTLLALVAALIALERAARRARGYAATLKRPRPPRPLVLTGARGWLALLAASAPVLLGFGVPAGVLAGEAWARGLEGLDPNLPRAAAWSLALAAGATLVVLILGVGLTIAARVARARGVDRLVAAASLGYALPGTVLALGLLAPVVAFDEALGAVSRALGGPALGLVVAGSPAVLVLAYAVRFLPVATGSLGAGLGRVAPRVDDAARTLGARPAELARRLHLPLLAPSLGGAALIVFVDALKELPATLLLRPLNLETLSTLLYASAARGSYEDGAAAALALVVAGLGPVVWLSAYADGPGA